MTLPALQMSGLELELVELSDRIRAAEADLDEAREAAARALEAHLLGEPDGEQLASTRAIAAWMASEIDQLRHAREILRHRIAATPERTRHD